MHCSIAHHLLFFFVGVFVWFGLGFLAEVWFYFGFFSCFSRLQPLFTQVRWWHFALKGSPPQHWLCTGMPPLMCTYSSKLKQHHPQHIFINSPRVFPTRSETILTRKQHPIKYSLKWSRKWGERARNLILHLCCNNATKDSFIWLEKETKFVLGKQDFAIKTPLKTFSQAGSFTWLCIPKRVAKRQISSFAD